MEGGGPDHRRDLIVNIKEFCVAIGCKMGGQGNSVVMRETTFFSRDRHDERPAYAGR
jgi:hypothetical protein